MRTHIHTTNACVCVHVFVESLFHCLHITWRDHSYQRRTRCWLPCEGSWLILRREVEARLGKMLPVFINVLRNISSFYQNFGSGFAMITKDISWFWYIGGAQIASLIGTTPKYLFYWWHPSSLFPKSTLCSPWDFEVFSLCGQHFFFLLGNGHRLSPFHPLSLLTYSIRSSQYHRIACGHQCGQWSRFQWSLGEGSRECVSHPL